MSSNAIKLSMKNFFTLSLIILFSGTLCAQKKWSLEECVLYALSNNLQVINGQYNNDIQNKNLQIAQKEQLPSLNGNINNSASFGQGRDVFGTVRRNDNYNNSASVNGNIFLYNNGRLKKNIEKSQYDLDAGLYDLETVKNNLSLQIAQQYLQILLNKEIKKIADEAVQNAETLLKRAKITTEVGTTPKTIEAEAVANLARERQNQITAGINIDRSLFNLAMLLQLKDYKSFDVQEVPLPELLDQPLKSTDSILITAFENQPQIKASQSRISAAQKQIELVETNFYPTVSASSGIGSSYFDPFAYSNPGFLKQYRDNFGQNIGLNVSIPIFNKGITKLQVEQAKISESIAANNLLQEKLQVQQDVQKAYFDATSNYENFIAAQEAEKSTKLAMEFAEMSYNAGRTTIYDLNNARNNWISAQGSVAQAKYNYIFSMKLLNFYAGIPLTID